MSTGSAILQHCNADEVDRSGVFDFDDDEYEHVFNKKTHTLLFKFVGLDVSLFLDIFMKTPTNDILMGRNTTIKIEVSVVELPFTGSAGGRKRKCMVL